MSYKNNAKFTMIIVLALYSCGVSKFHDLYNEIVELKVESFDNDRFKFYTVYGFKTSKSKGNLLVYKADNKILTIDSLYSERLCRIHTFRMNDGTSPRSNRYHLGKIYVNGLEEIDLAKDTIIKYYEICR